MRSIARSARRLAPLASRWNLATCLLIALGLTACVTPARTSRPVIDPPPAALAAPCVAGPEYPSGASAPLGDVLKVVEARETAHADCRARNAGLLAAWPK